MNDSPTLEQLEEELSAKKDYLILEELIEDAEEKFKLLLRYKVVEEISNEPDEKRIATQLGIKLRYRAYTEQGGIVERLFLNLL